MKSDWPDDFSKGSSLFDDGVDEETAQLSGILKIPIAEYIFYIYVESEKNTVELIKGQGKDIPFELSKWINSFSRLNGGCY